MNVVITGLIVTSTLATIIIATSAMGQSEEHSHVSVSSVKAQSQADGRANPQTVENLRVDKVTVVAARMYAAPYETLPDAVFVAGGPQHFQFPIRSSNDGGQAGATAEKYKLRATAFDQDYVLFDKGYMIDNCGYCIHKNKNTYFVIVVAASTNSQTKWTNLARDLDAAFTAITHLNNTSGKSSQKPIWVPLFGNGIFSSSRQADGDTSKAVVLKSAMKSGMYITIFTG